MTCLAFVAGAVLGGGVIHWRWRRWNKTRRIHIDTTGPDYIEAELKPPGNGARRQV